MPEAIPVRFPTGRAPLASVLLAAGLALSAASPAKADFFDIAFSGASSRDGWVGLTRYNFTGYGGFPGTSAWPAPIGSNEGASGDGILSRIAGATGGGGPFLAEDSLYFGSFQQVPNSLGGTLRVSDPTPLAGARTIVFQIQIGEAEGYDFFSPTGGPVLRVNGATLLQPVVKQLLNRYLNGTFFSPETLQDEPVYVNSWGFQWNVNGLGPITSLEIDFSGVTHGQVYRLRLDQSEDLLARNIFLPDFRLVARGTPVFDGSNTTVTHRFASTPGTMLDVDFRTTLTGPWTPGATTQTAGPDGMVDIAFSQSGDQRTPWSRGMFFRAAYHAVP